MNIPLEPLTSRSTKVKNILNDSLALERKRRHLTIETSQLIKQVEDLKPGIDRDLIQAWLTELMEDLR